MLNILSKVNKDITALAIGKMLQVTLALLSVRLLTTFLSETQIGSYYLLLTLLTLFNFAFLNPVGQYYNRYVLYWKNSSNLSNANVMLFLARTLGIVLSLFVAAFIFYIFDYSELFTIGSFLFFIFFSLAAGSYLVFLNVINLLGNRLCFIKYLLASLILGIVIAIVTNLFISKTGMAWLYGVAIAQIILFVPMYKVIGNYDKVDVSYLFQKINLATCKKVLIFSLPVTLTLFLQWGQNSSYRIIVEDKYTVEVLSYIAVGLAVSTSIFTAVEGLATQYFMPDYLKNINNSTKDTRALAWNYLASYMIPIYFLLMIFVICTSPFLMTLLVNEKYHNAYPYVMIGASIEFFRVTSNLIYLVSQSEMRTKTTIFPYLLGFLLMMVGLYSLSESSPLWFVPIILSFTYFLISTLLFFNMRKLLIIKIPFKSLGIAIILSLPFITLLFINSNIGLVASFIAVGAFGCFFLFSSFLIIKRAKNNNVYLDRN